MIEFTNFVKGGTWEAKYLVLLHIDDEGVPDKMPIDMIKWDVS